MKDIEMLNGLVAEIKEPKKLDKVYKEILLPKLQRMAKEFKKKELQIADNCHDNPMGFKLEEIMGRRITLQSLVETQMKPYLEQKGYKIGICSPSYFVYIRW
jgi:hypothetical protein